MVAYEWYLYDLPMWGDGNRGVKTAKVADDLGIQIGKARTVLERWRRQKKVRVLTVRRRSRWWRTKRV